MKFKIIITLSLLVAVSSFGQGLVSFQNANVSSQRISTNAVAAGGGTGLMSGASAGAFQFQFFYGTSSNLLNNSSAVFLNSTTNGLIAGSPSISLALPGGSIWVQAFGWSVGYTLAQAQTTPGAFWGTTTLINPTASTSPAPAAPLFGTPSAITFGGFTMNIVTVPEPSTMVLAGLGAASLLLFRRRKQA